MHELGFARFGERHELAGHAAADLAGVGLDGTVVHAHAIADAPVRLAHLVVGLLQRLLVGVEAVGVLHDELAAAQKPEARTDLVAELHLDLVQRQRQLLVGAQLVAHEGGDELLVGGPEAELAVVTVDEAHELGAVVVPAAALVPQLAGLQRRHHDLLRADAVHLLAHDVLHLGQHALAQRQEGVHARCRLADEARAQKQPVAGDLRVGGILLERGRVQLAHAHDIHVRHSFPISSIKASTMALSSTLRTTFPFENTTPEPTPHATPMSASAASPGRSPRSHDGHLERLVEVRDASLHLARQPDEVHLATAACGAADELWSASAQVER